MKDYKRLKEKISNMLYPPLPFDGDELTGEDIKELWDILNKIENGTLVELPCKVGDIVYRIRKRPYMAVLPRKVVSITYCIDCKGQVEWRIFTTEQDTLGKRVFLTKAEAEKKLEELENE